MMRKIKLTRANKSILLKALAPYYYQEKALGHITQEPPGRLILKIDSVPADKKATFSTEEIRLMRITINRLRNERLGKRAVHRCGRRYAAKIILNPNNIKTKSALQKYIAMRFSKCDREDSNLWPSGSEPNALSS